ncbi:hypothetical protein BgiBS90_021272 [Biomphalaria glabrata]|nr:hypothetical protein BgiBS90_021272 [Biomphalaria glabrata]
MLDEIIGPVRAATPRVRKRAAEKATLLTASPFKKRLEEKKISVRVSSKVGGAASQTTKKGKERQQSKQSQLLLHVVAALKTSMMILVGKHGHNAKIANFGTTIAAKAWRNIL